MAPPNPRRNLRRGAHEPRDLRVLLRPARLAADLVARRHVRLRDHVPRLHGRARAPVDPAREYVRSGPRARRGGHRLAAARLVLAREVPQAVLAGGRRRHRARLPVGLRHDDQRRRELNDRRPATAADLRHPAAAPLLRQPADHVRAAAVLRPEADEGLRAGRCGLGRQARRRARPDREQGRGREGHRAVVGGRRVPRRGRQARARPALHRPAGHRQDDALQGHRDVVQLTDRDDAGLRLRADVHRHGRHHRDGPHPQGAAARPQVGRHLHGVHRRDRRCRHAPSGARHRRALPAAADLHRAPAVRAVGRAQPQRRPHARGRALARPRLRRPRRAAPRRHAPPPREHPPARPRATVPAGPANIRGRANGFMFPGGMGGMGGGLALNQLLVQMDGVDEPPFMRKFFTNRLNTFLDATYVVPRKIGKMRLRVKPPKPRPEQVYFIGATNVPIDALDPALVRPGRMGRHIWFRTPTKDDRSDIFDLYLGRVAHDPELDRPERRDELARMTSGYSPAMIEQVCSMALTYAHSDARPEFDRADIVEAMTTIESGTAVGVTYVDEETRAVAIHEAGHAVTSQVYMRNTISTRLSIRKRGDSQGHHAAIATEERFSKFRHEIVGDLVWSLGAMAAEREFYGENTNGVGGDLQSATSRVASMVGAAGMGPEPLDLRGRVPKELLEETEQRIMDRFERIGLQIMNRASAGSALQGDWIASSLGDPAKRKAAAQILGQAYITALCCVRHNREAVARIAEVLVQKKELYGDEVVDLLRESSLEAPVIDILDESIWPKL